MNTLRSEQLSKRLYWAMSIVIFCLLLICIPLIVNSSQKFTQSYRTYYQLEALRDLADLANKISRERGPANMLMISSADEFKQKQEMLLEYRAKVDDQLEHTAQQLKESGFNELSQQIYTVLKPSLEYGRQQVDAYVALPYDERNAAQLDTSILAMFQVWDNSRRLLKSLVIESDVSSSKIAHFVSQILLLADLRDQAGRVVSNITAPVTFGETIPEQNRNRSLQTQYRVRYLWDLIDTVQPKEDKTPEFIKLHQDIKKYFIDQGIPLAASLIEDSLQHRPYHLTAMQISEMIGDHFAKVVDMQSYLLQYSHDVAQKEMRSNLKYLIGTIVISLISLMTAISSMVFARRHIFLPLIHARKILFDLSSSAKTDSSALQSLSKDNSDSLFAGIKKLQQMLQQRDALEFRLKNIAHSDPLTGLSNRFALDEYIRFLEQSPSQFSQTCLMIIDIDHFKQVNDQYGHIVGDEIIQLVAQCLKSNVRTSDLLVRYGGDEFLVLIENIELENALQIAEKICREIEAASIQNKAGERIQVSVSIGVAVGASSWVNLFTQADKALFGAKAKGRNAVAEA
ncbi:MULTISPECIES: GGDEF domain-containing protein [Acinetobacter]|uniref:GGDEF domain-containing protein n=1 Tax=Acinetobacter TaxID=469 RepID=UPI000539297C|nr:GGDEF domain-containing protein [Acinetobacter sp. HR7]KGT46300.1 hypothetical protein GW12_27130 [Acinetobacter sp. HR7]